jgi:hypothetical protein
MGTTDMPCGLSGGQLLAVPLGFDRLSETATFAIGGFNLPPREGNQPTAEEWHAFLDAAMDFVERSAGPYTGISREHFRQGPDVVRWGNRVLNPDGKTVHLDPDYPWVSHIIGLDHFGHGIAGGAANRALGLILPPRINFQMWSSVDGDFDLAL